jgi:hypothetical protein
VRSVARGGLRLSVIPANPADRIVKPDCREEALFGGDARPSRTGA